MGHGLWATGHGPWALGHGPWAMGLGPWALGHGPWAMGPEPNLAKSPYPAGFGFSDAKSGLFDAKLSFPTPNLAFPISNSPSRCQTRLLDAKSTSRVTRTVMKLHNVLFSDPMGVNRTLRIHF